MMYDPNLLRETQRHEENDRNRKAELARLMEEGREAQPALSERMLVAVADALIAVGERMREGHEGHPAAASR